MKKLLAILCCLAFAAGAAEAKTYYVDATRPNNNGNGLKLSTAKKSIQGAINIAAAGDTILVYPGKYPAIKTNNKKITIKSAKGASKTAIVRSSNSTLGIIAQLGKGSNWYEISGKNTSLVGFLLDGRNNHWGTLGVVGGQLASCLLQRIYGSGTVDIASKATLSGCIIRNNDYSAITGSILNRCKIMGNTGCPIYGSRLSNCLVTNNKGWGYVSSGKPCASLFETGTVVVNCTIAKNCTWYSSGKTPLFSYKAKFFNCILRNNYHRTKTWNSKGQVVYGKIVIHNADTAKTYANTYYQTFTDNRDPKFTNPDKGDFTLKKGSGCINKGKLTDTLKRYVGTTDLAGKTRVRGSAIDMGCYEY